MSGGGSGGGSSQNTTTTTAQVAPYAQPAAEEVLGRGLTLSRQPYQAYPGQRIADFSPETQQGLTGNDSSVAREKFFGTEVVQAIRNRHFVWMLGWSEKMERQLESKNQTVRLKQIKRELDNIPRLLNGGSARIKLSRA